MNKRIVFDPNIHHGKPVIKGTRVPVARILGGLAGGMTVQDLIREYEVTEKDVEAVLDYAADLVDHEQVFALGR